MEYFLFSLLLSAIDDGLGLLGPVAVMGGDMGFGMD